MSNLKHNEKMKLTAAFYNNLGVASPTASWLVHLISMVKSGFVDVTIISGVGGVIGVLIGTLLHRFAQHFLNYLIDE
jgi:hypothetical protein